MFLDLNQHHPDSLAAIDQHGRQLSYGNLCFQAELLARQLPARSLVFSFCENSFASLIGYVAFMANGVVPLLLDNRLESGLCNQLIERYHPTWIWRPQKQQCAGKQGIFHFEQYELVPTELPPYPLHDDLALLVTTSGSTGSPRLVRQSYRNILSNAQSIAEYLAIDNQERPVANLPMNYVYGLSVINSHLLKGATLLLTNQGLMQKAFWTFIKKHQASSIAGVPYTYEMLKKLRFFTMTLPALRALTQAGGKLLPDLHREFARYAQENGKKFVVMYGASEATSRMGYLPAGQALEKYGSIGKAIPGGRFSIINEQGNELNGADETGELVYFGDNVMLGYAESGEDLQKGDECNGRLATGDMVRRDSDGFYYVVGRKKRFLKVFGIRIGLDEMENMIKSAFSGLECACGGIDDLIHIFVTDPECCEKVKLFAVNLTRLHHSAFRLNVLAAIPKNDAGKILYSRLEEYYGQL